MCHENHFEKIITMLHRSLFVLMVDFSSKHVQPLYYNNYDNLPLYPAFYSRQILNSNVENCHTLLYLVWNEGLDVASFRRMLQKLKLRFIINHNRLTIIGKNYILCSV